MLRIFICMLLLCSASFATHPENIDAATLKRIKSSVAEAKYGKDNCSDARVFKDVKKEWGGPEKEGICVSLENSGFKPKAKYKLYVTKLDGNSMFYSMVWANDQGKLIFENQQVGPKIVDGCLMALGGCMLGEEMTYTLISLDGSKDFSTRIAHLPIFAKSNDGAYIYMFADSPSMERFYLKAYGFKPNEKLSCTSCSCQERMDYTFSVDEHGERCIAMAPAVIGFNGGQACLIIKRENSESLKISYFWGHEAFKNGAPNLEFAQAKKILQGVEKAGLKTLK